MCQLNALQAADGPPPALARRRHWPAAGTGPPPALTRSRHWPAAGTGPQAADWPPPVFNFDWRTDVGTDPLPPAGLADVGPLPVNPKP